MNIAFDHRPLQPLDAIRMYAGSVRITVRGSRSVLALVASVIVIAGTAGALDLRLRAARSNLTVDLLQRDRTAALAAPARSMLRRIDDLRGLSAEIALAQRSGDGAADELVRLGNAFPPHVWIARFRRDRNDLVVDGGAGTVDAVGRALVALNAGHARAELVGLKDAGRPDSSSDIRYSLRIDSP
jgi:hypothetical protein